MDAGEVLVEVCRGGRVESVHSGHAVVMAAGGEVVASWGSPDVTIYPRSSCKMIQALPLVESGAADAFGLSEEELALACASHRAAPVHTRAVSEWLARIGRSEGDLCCGPELPRDPEAQLETIKSGVHFGRVHNNCSGKHTGFLTLAKHLGAASADYVDSGHPVQQAVRAAFEEVTGEASPGFGIDGCSAPNFTTSLTGLARAMAGFTAADDTTVRSRAQRRLFSAMARYPVLVAGNGGADTELMRAMDGKVVVKTGAEGVYVAIWPERKLGIALKIADGATRASECAIASLLVKLGALDAAHPAAKERVAPAILDRRGAMVGEIRPSETLIA